MKCIILILCNIIIINSYQRCTDIEDHDIEGNDIESIAGLRREDCCQYCGQVLRCKSYTWTDVDDGTCLLKSATGTIMHKNGSKLGIMDEKIYDSDQPNCGIRPPSFRIVNGREAAPHSWPWMASLLEPDGTEWKHFCGGSLVSPTTIVTAAHCFKYKTKDDPIRVRLGAHKLSEKGEDELQLEVASVNKNEWYNNQPASLWDIAIVTLATAVEYTDNISPVCLGKPHQINERVVCYVTGWGRTHERAKEPSDVLMELEVPVLPKNECLAQIGEKFDEFTQLCGAYENGGKDACQGDSGGPLVCEEENSDTWRLQGIVSWGKGCARKGNPGVYTKVSFYEEWIEQHTLINS